MDPTPAPLDDELVIVSENLVGFAGYAFAGLLVALVLVTILVWAIYKSAQFQPQAMLVMVLGVLALVASIGYFVGGDERAELITLAAAAVGALAGALTLMTNRFVEISKAEEEAKKVDSIPPTKETPPTEPEPDKENADVNRPKRK